MWGQGEIARKKADLELHLEALDAAVARMEVAAAEVKTVPTYIEMLKAAWIRRDYEVLKKMINVLVQQVDVRVDEIRVKLYVLPEARVYELDEKVAPTGIEPVPPP